MIAPTRTFRGFAELRPLLLQTLRAATAPMTGAEINAAMGCQAEPERKAARDVLRHLRAQGAARSAESAGHVRWTATGKRLLCELRGPACQGEPRTGRELRVAILGALRSTRHPLSLDELYLAIGCAGAAERKRCRGAMKHLDHVQVIYRVMHAGVECWRASGKLMRSEIHASAKAALGPKPPRKRRPARPIKPQPAPAAPAPARWPRVASVWDLAGGAAA